MRQRDPKAVLMEWVDDQVQLDSRTKYILDKFARFADPHARAWALVCDLAERTNSSERTVQYALRRLEADGLIRRTGAMYTLNEGSRFPRQVPIFQIAAGVEGIDPLAGEAAASGARFAPETALGCKDEPAGVQMVAPRNELMGTDTPSDEGDARAQEREAQFERLEAAYPKRGLGFTNRARARSAFLRLAEEGLDADLLIAAAAAFTADRAGKKTDQSLEYWLEDRKFRGWWPEPQQALEPGAKAATEGLGDHAAPEADQAVWRTVLDRLAEAMPGGDFANYVRPAALGLAAGALHVVALTGYGRDQIKARLWRRMTTTWAEADAAARPLTLVSKHEFEALVRQSEGGS